MIVLDAGVLIGYLEPADAWHDDATRLLTECVGQPWGAHPMTVAEVLVGPARRGDAWFDQAIAVLAALEVTELPVGAGDAQRLARLRASTGLRLPDCCVLLAATDANATLASFDRRLAGEAARRGLPVFTNRAGA